MCACVCAAQSYEDRLDSRIRVDETLMWFFSQVGLDFQTTLLNVNLTAVDKPTQKEVEMFLIAIQKNPPTMNLDGYADINRGLITSVC